MLSRLRQYQHLVDAKLAIIKMDIICDLMWDIPRSCQKYLIKGHFKRLLRSYIMQMGTWARNFLILTGNVAPFVPTGWRGSDELGLQQQ